MPTSLPRPSSARLLILLCVTFLLWVPHGAMAQQQPAGRVTVAVGLVEAVAANGDVRRLQRGDPVFESDTLRSGANGRAQLRFTDRSMLSLRPDTVLALEDYAFDAGNPAAGRQTLTLDRGGFRTQTGAIARANRSGYRVQTPVGVIGVRGTIFECHQEAGGGLLVGANQGGVLVESSTGQVGAIGVGEAFDYLRVNPDGSIEFLLEVPEVFSVSPGIDEQGSDDEGSDVDAGDTGSSSVAAGGGAAESTAGFDADLGGEGISSINDPEAGGIIAPAEVGSGEPPTTEPLEPVASKALTAAELAQLQAGFGYVQAECCFTGRAFKGRTTDPRLSAGRDTVLANGGIGVLNPIFNDVAPNNVIVRRDGAFVALYEDIGGPAELSQFEWQGFGDGGPMGIYNALDGSLIRGIDGNLLVLAGRITDVASLIGTGRYEIVELTQGFFLGDTSIEPQVLAGADISFNVDFGSGQVFGGVARAFINPADASSAPGSRDRLEAFFTGQVGLANANPFVDFTVSGGRVFNADGTRGGNGLIDADESSLVGMFAGDGSIFNMAFSLTSRSDPALSSPFERINAVGTAVLGRQDLRLQPAEITQIQQGRIFVAAGCCDADSGTAVGVASDPLAALNGAFVLGENLDAEGFGLSRFDPDLFRTTPTVIARKAGAIASLNPDFPVHPDIGLVAGGWFGRDGNRPLIIDPDTGTILEEIDDTVLFMVGFPSTIAALQSTGFTTFAGASNRPVEFEGETVLTAGGFARSNVADILPPVTFTPGVSISFNVDFATGQVSGGHLYLLTNFDTSGPFDQEQGFSLFFDGQVALSAGNPVIAVNVIDGVFGKNTPVNVADSEIDIFFGGAGEGTDSDLVAFGAASIQTLGPDPIVYASTFSVGRFFLAEQRLTAAEALQLSPPGEVRLGMAAFSRLANGSPAGLPIGAEGLLLGRAADASVLSDPFILGANPLYVRDVDGSPVATSTRRRSFLSQPYEFLLRRNSALEVTPLFESNVRPMGAPDYSAQGFAISWGAWAASSPGTGAKIHNDRTDNANGVIIDRDVFFASIRPTPQGQMPVMGVFSYGGSLGGGDLAVLGSGGGSISGASAASFTDFSVDFEVDFTTGAISNGSLMASYIEPLDSLVTDWNVGFGGFVNGAVADLAVNSLAVSFDGVAAGGPSGLYPFDASISGIFTGPGAERFGGGFSITAEGSLSGTFESIEGLFVIDRLSGVAQ
ncbi:MAG: FecR domain-containing protein [Gammaproteobacteria bacterium]|nr:FecR domain-containing protein [Gammaproteobacteria bacterium]